MSETSIITRAFYQILRTSKTLEEARAKFEMVAGAEDVERVESVLSAHPELSGNFGVPSSPRKPEKILLPLPETGKPRQENSGNGWQETYSSPDMQHVPAVKGNINKMFGQSQLPEMLGSHPNPEVGFDANI